MTDSVKEAVEWLKQQIESHTNFISCLYSSPEKDTCLRHIKMLGTLSTAAQEMERLRDRIRFCEYFWAQEADLCWDITLINEKLRARIAKNEQDHERDIDHRDAAEEALSQAYYLITGRSPEWSNLFGHNEAIEEIDDAQRLLRARIAALEKDRPEVVTRGALMDALGDLREKTVRGVLHFEYYATDYLQYKYPNGIRIVQDKEGGL